MTRPGAALPRTGMLSDNPGVQNHEGGPRKSEPSQTCKLQDMSLLLPLTESKWRQTQEPTATKLLMLIACLYYKLELITNESYHFILIRAIKHEQEGIYRELF